MRYRHGNDEDGEDHGEDFKTDKVRTESGLPKVLSHILVEPFHVING